MAEDLDRAETAVPPAPRETPIVQRHRRQPLYRGRFALAYLVLALAAGAGVAAVFVIGGQEGKEAGATWSSWKPAGEESTYPSQIARKVATKYRLPSGKQLVAVLSGPPEVQNVRVRAVAIQGSPEAGEQGYETVEMRDAVMYVMCGLGEQCSIPEGRASVERGQLLQREALELALYTFKYVDGTDSVITLLPPRPNGTTSMALFFRKSDLRDALARPLETTLARSDAPRASRIAPTELVELARLTEPHLFTYRFQPLQDGNAILVLAPFGSTQ